MDDVKVSRHVIIQQFFLNTLCAVKQTILGPTVNQYNSKTIVIKILKKYTFIQLPDFFPLGLHAYFMGD